MGPVRQHPIQRTVSLFICVCIALCTIVTHNIAQNRPDSFPPYPPDNHHCSDDVYLREGGSFNSHTDLIVTSRPTIQLFLVPKRAWSLSYDLYFINKWQYPANGGS